MTTCNLANVAAWSRSTGAEGTLPSGSARARLLADLLVQARHHEAALQLATRVDDETVGATAARRLSRTLLRAAELVQSSSDPVAPNQVARLDEAMGRMCELLQRAKGVPPDRSLVGHRLLGVASGRLFEVRDGRSHVFGLDASGRELQEAAFSGLHVSYSRFITDLRRAQFSDALIEASDFTYADLRGTLWQRTRVRNCSLREASFMDAAFNDTMFIDCDLRGANFNLDGLDLSTMPGAAFIRCDLRDASWYGRDLLGFELADCKLDEPMEDHDHQIAPRSFDHGVGLAAGFGRKDVAAAEVRR